jgi:hypothetical protein
MMNRANAFRQHFDLDEDRKYNTFHQKTFRRVEYQQVAVKEVTRKSFCTFFIMRPHC